MLQAEIDPNKYKYDRAKRISSSIAEQLDYIYHNASKNGTLDKQI